MKSKLAILSAPLFNLSVFLDEVLAWWKSLNSAHPILINTNNVPRNTVPEHEFILLTRTYFYFSHSENCMRQFFGMCWH